MADEWTDEHVIARASVDNEYDAYGYVAMVDVAEDLAALANFSHCSCYGTWDDVKDRGCDWVGTPAELVALARRGGDPDTPDRAADPNDFDYGRLQDLYRQVIAWAEGRGELVDATT